MKLDGSCFCGAVRFEAEGDPERVVLCHCVDCQEFTGTAFRMTLPVRSADFRLLQGAPKVFLKTAASGRKRRQAFCGDCGSPIYGADAVEAPKVLGLRVGTLKQRRELPPRKQIWHDSALPFVAHLFDDLPAAGGE